MRVEGEEVMNASARPKFRNANPTNQCLQQKALLFPASHQAGTAQLPGRLCICYHRMGERRSSVPSADLHAVQKRGN